MTLAKTAPTPTLPEGLRLTRDAAGVATVTLSRPRKLNALTFEMYEGLRDLFRVWQEDEALRAVVMTGEGDGFCSGGDVDLIVEALAKQSTAQTLRFARLTGEAVLAIRQLRRPVLAAVNGVAVGGGAALALAADLRVVAENARLGFVFPRLGLSGADMGCAWLLPRLIGLSRATELLFTGGYLDANAALAVGLAHRVTPQARVVNEAQSWAAELAKGPAFALGMTKEMLNREQHMDLATALEAEAQAQQICLASVDFREAVRARARKRPPRFQGR
jgi:enoyl-CoA hydratase/carnithine racemase